MKDEGHQTLKITQMKSGVTEERKGLYELKTRWKYWHIQRAPQTVN